MPPSAAAQCALFVLTSISIFSLLQPKPVLRSFAVEAPGEIISHAKDATVDEFSGQGTPRVLIKAISGGESLEEGEFIDRSGTKIFLGDVSELKETCEMLVLEREEMLEETVQVLEASKKEGDMRIVQERDRVKGEWIEFLRISRAYWKESTKKGLARMASATSRRFKMMRAFSFWRLQKEREARSRMRGMIGDAIQVANEEIRTKFEEGGGKLGSEKKKNSNALPFEKKKRRSMNNPFEKLVS